MPDKNVRIVGPKKFHLKGKKDHFPTANLAGGRDNEAGKKIDFDLKKVSWVAAYVDASNKLAGDQDVDFGGQDAAINRQLAYIDQLAMQNLREGLSQQGVDPKELDSLVKSEWPKYRDQLRQEVRQQVSQEERRVEGRRSGQTLEGTDPSMSDVAANRAAQSKRDYLASLPQTRTQAGIGTAGLIDPIAQAMGPIPGAVLPQVASTVGTVADQFNPANKPVDITGKLTDTTNAGADPFLSAKARMDDRAADLLKNYYAATQRGDQAGAQAIAQELQQARSINPRDIASQSLNGGTTSDVGSQLSNLVSGPFYNPMAAGVGAASPILAGAAGAYYAPPGQRLSAAWQAAKETLPTAAQGVATGAAIRGALGPATAAMTQGGFTSRLGSTLSKVLKPASLLRAGVLTGGIQGIRDLAEYTTDEGKARMRGELVNQIEANKARGTGGKLLDATGAGARILLGNLDPARRQLGASAGRYEWAANTPMGRTYRETEKEDAATQAAIQAKQRAHELMTRDPRFANMDMAQREMMASSAADNAYTTAQLEHGRTPGTVNNWMTNYAAAKAALNEGKATPEQTKYLEELSGSPVQAGQMTPQQQQTAGQTAALYHTFNRGPARQVIDYARSQAAAKPAVAPVATPAVPTAPVVAPIVNKTAADQTVSPIKPIEPIADVKPTEPTAAPAVPEVPPTGVPQVQAQAPTTPAPVPAQTPVQPAVPQTPAAQPRIPYQEAVNNLMKTRDVNQYHDWAAGATQQERDIANREIYRQGAQSKYVPDFIQNPLINHQMEGLSNEQIQKTIMDQAKAKALEVGKQVQESARSDWKGNKGGWANYIASNPMMLLLPIGLAVALGSKGKMGKILGILSAIGGATNLYGRYQALQDKGFHKAVADRAIQTKAGTWTPESEQTWQQQHGQAWKDLQAVDQSGIVNIPQQVSDSATQTMQESLTGAPQQAGVPQ